MKKTAVFAVFMFLFSAIFVYASKPKTTIKILPAGTITVDGSLDDWKKAGIKPIVLNKKEQLTHGALDWDGTSGSGEVYVAFTNDKFYMAANITSPKGMYNNNPGKDMWNGNAVEIFLGFDNSNPTREMYTESDYQIGFSPGRVLKDGTRRVPAEIYSFNMITSITEGDEKYGKIKAKATKNGYLLEAEIEADFFDAWYVQDGLDIGFDISIDDVGPKSVARQIQFTWSGYKESWKDPAGWGIAILKE